MIISKIWRPLLFLFLMSAVSNAAFAQIEKHATWKFIASKPELKIGETLEITIEAVIDQGWYLYSTEFNPNLDAPHTEITFEGSGFREAGKVKAIGAIEKYDEIWEGNIKTFTGKATFKQKLIITESNPQITVNVDGQVCSHESGLCVRAKENYVFNTIKAEGIEKTPDKEKTKNPVIKTTENYSSGRLKELEKAKLSLVKKDSKGRDQTREYLKNYIRQNGGNK